MVNTLLEVGNNQETQKRYKEIPIQLAKLQNDLQPLNRLIGLLGDMEKKDRLPPNKKEQLDKARNTRDLLTVEMKDLAEEYEAVKESLAAFGYGIINITDTVYSGVRIFIGSESMSIETNYQHCSFTRDQKGIQAGPCRT